MNKRLAELAVQAGLNAKEIREDGSQTLYAFENFDIEKFAELVRDDERAKCASDYLQDCCDAVDAARLEEREACAKLCEEVGRQTAEAIRARSEPSPAFKNYMDDNWAGIV